MVTVPPVPLWCQTVPERMGAMPKMSPHIKDRKWMGKKGYITHFYYGSYNWIRFPTGQKAKQTEMTYVWIL